MLQKKDNDLNFDTKKNKFSIGTCGTKHFQKEGKNLKEKIRNSNATMNTKHRKRQKKMKQT